MLDMIASQTSIPSQTKSNEWYTPSKYIEAARSVMGSIDLDPASCEVANQTVKATRYYTKEDDGLSKKWNGNVWLNPPYHPYEGCRHPEATWTRRLIKEYQDGNIEQAVLLICAEIKYKWFHEVFDFHVCLATDRIQFIRPGLTPQELRVGTALVYLGPNEQRFIEVFSQFGTIAKRVNPAPVKPSMCELWEVEQEGHNMLLSKGCQ